MNEIECRYFWELAAPPPPPVDWEETRKAIEEWINGIGK